MSSKPIIRREQADRVFEAIIDYYLEEGGETAASGFLEALERGHGHIARHPASGSPRYGYELGEVGLRAWQISRYPYLILYIERVDRVDVLRILHCSRDIPTSLGEPESR